MSESRLAIIGVRICEILSTDLYVYKSPPASFLGSPADMLYSMTADMINVPTYTHISLVAGWVEAPGGSVASSWHSWHVVARGENGKSTCKSLMHLDFFFFVALF